MSKTNAFLTALLTVWLIATGAQSFAQTANKAVIVEGSAAADPEGARQFITALSDNVINVLNDTTKTQSERDEAFRELLRDGFALKYISRLILGRHRRGADRTLLQEFEEVFPEYVLRVYISRLAEFGDEEFIVENTAPAGKRDIFVRSQIVRPQGPSIIADWRVRKIDDVFKIIDLKIEGISMAVTQREEFSARISESSLRAVIDSLREDIASSDSAGVSAGESSDEEQKS